MKQMMPVLPLILIKKDMSSDLGQVWMEDENGKRFLLSQDVHSVYEDDSEYVRIY